MRYKIGIYIRVSTDEQAQILDGSLDNQEYRITAFLNLKNQDNEWGELIERFVDDGYSAGDTRRPAYQKMLKAIESKAVTLILISDLSRLSRNMSDFCDFYKILEKHHASFISIKEQFDTSTSFGEMMVFNMINLSQFERRQTSERILINFHARALRGLINGGSPLLGFDRDPTHSGKRIVNPSEANLVRRIFKMYDQGQSFSFIRDQLNSEMTARKMSTSEHWNCHAIQTILKNYAFIGMREVNPQNKNQDQDTLKPYQKYQLTSATWPAIVSKKLFSSVQKRIEEAYKKERKRYDKSKQRFFLLSGKLRCKECLRSLVGQSAHGKNKAYRYYGHQNPSGKRITCSIKRYSADKIEALISEHLSKLKWQSHTFSLYKKSIVDGIPHLQKRLFGQLVLDMIIDESGIHLWYRETEKIGKFRVADEPSDGEHLDITQFWCSPIYTIGGCFVPTSKL